MNGIYFPGIGIDLTNVPSGFTIFGFTIKFYGLIIATGFMLALLISMKHAKKSGQNPDDYIDFLLWMVIPVILGARIYYIIFDLDNYIAPGKSFGQTFLDMINIRNGGLAIYGGLIAGVITAAIFAKKRKLSLPLMGDTICMGVMVGQIMGRWGNFFNREAFGAYTNSIFRMAIPLDYYRSQGSLSYLLSTNVITEEMQKHTELVNGLECITVHPTFLYEGIWNFALLILVFAYRKHKKFDGEMAMIYVAGYGLGRFFVEWLRSDSLMIGPLKVSQMLGMVLFLLCTGVIVWNRLRIKKGIEPKLHLVK